MEEIEYRELPNYPKYYAGSDGNIYSDRKGNDKFKLKPRSYKNTYLYVLLYTKNNKHKKVYVHKIIAEMFLGPIPYGCEVCHGPGGKSDNSVINLSYNTHTQNMRDKVRDGTLQRGIRHGKSKLTEEQVKTIRLLANNIKVPEIARLYNMSIRQIYAIIRRDVWQHI